MITFVFCWTSLAFAVFLTILCLGRKKKKPATVPIADDNVSNRRLSRRSATSTPDEIEEGYASIDIPNNVVGGQARVLPEIPSQETATTGNLQRPNSHSEHSSLGSGETARRHSNSPKSEQAKSRKLPTPPELSNDLNENTMSGDGDANVYANVDEEQHGVKPAPQRRKIHTLDIKEGSGDSSFYAKVGDVVEVEEEVGGAEMLYAQVNDNPTSPSWVSSSSSSEQHPTSPPLPKPNPKPNLPKPNNPASIYQNGGPEYATIDKVNKKNGTPSILKIPSENADIAEEPPAPPIPDRNFVDTDDELETDPHSDIPHIDADVATPPPSAVAAAAASNNGSEGPTYDKLCVRESLDHLRCRQEVESKRRAKYANIQQSNGVTPPHNEDDETAAAAIAADGDEQSHTAVYAQIEENVEEAVYESVSGSADGTFRPPPQSSPPPQQAPPIPTLPHPPPHHRLHGKETSFSNHTANSNNNNTSTGSSDYTEIARYSTIPPAAIVNHYQAVEHHHDPSPSDNTRQHHYEQIHRV